MDDDINNNNIIAEMKKLISNPYAYARNIKDKILKEFETNVVFNKDTMKLLAYRLRDFENDAKSGKPIDQLEINSVLGKYMDVSDLVRRAASFYPIKQKDFYKLSSEIDSLVSHVKSDLANPKHFKLEDDKYWMVK